ncbi:MAG: lipoate--protein ligase family protein [Desulfuromonadales bacterium]|nr:lipoate--protein ligase family protein [Desulfuromonadales bacterium]
MATDEALLQSFVPESSQPVLRIYGWNPPALSIGRFQKAADVLDLERYRDAGLQVVRRITGGGSIYHADELTYSIVCTPEQIPTASSVKDSFRILTGFLMEFYRRLNLDVSYAVDTVSKDHRLGTRTAFCFAGRESFDILAHGKKIGGNAQRRLRNVIFQHGSIPIINRSETGLSYMLDKSPEYARGTTSLDECGILMDANSLRLEILAAFRDHFSVKLSSDELTRQESECADRLLLKKYGSDDWNLEGVEV